MLSFPTPNVYQSAKCFLTYGTMSHPDPTQLPTKGKPWSTLLSQGFIHRVDLVIPREALKKVRAKLDAQCPVHYRVIMKLGDIISGEFFKEYIKIGNIMMLSEGRIGTDNVFTLKDGTLTLYLEKETYERVGIVGQPHGVKGRRGTKPRWSKDEYTSNIETHTDTSSVVQYDLRNPSSFAGKKGFDRLVYACDNVLNQPVTWLFCNLSKTPDPDPLQSHFPTKYSSSPLYVETVRAIVPSLKPPQAILESGGRDNLVEFATCIYEWLSLLRLESPRANADDKIDPYLSRYAVPGAPEELQEAILCKVSWQGFMSPTWTRQTLVDIILATSSQSWFSLSVASFGKGVSGEGTECSILRPPNSPGEYFLWDIHGHE